MSQDILDQYISICSQNLEKNNRILSMLKGLGIYERFIFENFRLGFSDGNILEVIGENGELIEKLTTAGLIKSNKELLKNYIIIPLLDENKAIVNIAAYNIFPQTKKRYLQLNEEGIFNRSFLKNSEEIIFTDNPINALILIQNDFSNTTFLGGSEEKYHHFITANQCKKTIFTFEGHASLFYKLTSSGISSRRIELDFEKCKNGNASNYLKETLSEKQENKDMSSDIITEIENGFIFRFPNLNYRLIGNFSGNDIKMITNIKAYNDKDVFMDRIDLCKNRDRQNFIFNILEKFNLRDQVQIENELNQMIDVIEKYKEKQEKSKKKLRPDLTENQKAIGLNFLKSPNIFDEIDKDYTALGYVRERKNKILLYLIMTSRLMDNPLPGIIISRSGAGKSQIAEITEMICPPEEVESISDLSAQALYYFENLKHKFVVIGEKKGSEGADYPLRELISKKSITKAVPMKDPVTGQIKTVSIKVDGPISLIETSTEIKEINHENLNRCFVISIDETETQTALIHKAQRYNYTIEGFKKKQRLTKIVNKHHYAQRLLKKIRVFNPFAELLTFPTSKLKTRRDNEKLLRLINVICFLNQYQRRKKTFKHENQEIEYIECTPQDYKTAYDLLADGVLDNTLDDLPQQSRKLLDHIKGYLKEKSKADNIPIEKIIFERKEIREHTSWSFAQIRNNFRILRDYEYLHLLKTKNGLANQYRLSGDYSDLDFLNTILSPEQLKKKLHSLKFDK